MGYSDSIWPYSDLVSLVYRHTEPGIDVLELGPGTGANVPLFQARKCRYAAIEKDEVCIKRLQKRGIPVMHQDFTKAPKTLTPKYDLIFDRCSVCNNDRESIDVTVALIEAHLKPGGLFIGVDWYTASCPPGITWVCTPIVAPELLFAAHGFEVLECQRKIMGTTRNGKNVTLATANFVVRKPK